MSEKISVNVITDDMLEPYFVVCEKGKVIAYKKKIRNKKDGTKETVTSRLGESTSIDGALKFIVEDAFSYKREVMVTISEYVKSYREMMKRLKSKFKISADDYL